MKQKNGLGSSLKLIQVNLKSFFGLLFIIIKMTRKMSLSPEKIATLNHFVDMVQQRKLPMPKLVCSQRLWRFSRKAKLEKHLVNKHGWSS